MFTIPKRNLIIFSIFLTCLIHAPTLAQTQNEQWKVSSE
jgi:hypothetical protein